NVQAAILRCRAEQLTTQNPTAWRRAWRCADRMAQPPALRIVAMLKNDRDGRRRGFRISLGGRNLWRRDIGSCASQFKREWLHGLEFRFESRKSIEIKFASISSDFSSVIAIVHYQNSNHVHFLFMRRPATSLTHNDM